MEAPPFGMSNGKGDDEEALFAAEREMSPPWIMNEGMRRWNGVSLYAPEAQRARKF